MKMHPFTMFAALVLVAIVPTTAQTWTFTIVDGGYGSGMTGSPISLSLDPADTTHIARTGATGRFIGLNSSPDGMQHIEKIVFRRLHLS
ncbi:MAG: hypothetical protein GF346_05760 [Candidatus Eisenbacteria bacterium]|nr:hypothetical protein [Candidatus Latescibacterota bacterium]MBD3301934.1 hypothetical protein [Candidatus Eisenbacteria bacterium]